MDIFAKVFVTVRGLMALWFCRFARSQSCRTDGWRGDRSSLWFHNDRLLLRQQFCRWNTFDLYLLATWTHLLKPPVPTFDDITATIV
jgi:hypothetical protein